MKNRIFITIALLGWLAGPDLIHAQSTTAFTYQGQLTDGGQPANGYYDLRFVLYGQNSGGSPIANTIAKPPILVKNGLFVTTLDYGTEGFPWEKRWLEIAVRRTGVAGGYQTLSPRQRITATPYALQSQTVADGAITADKLQAGTGQDGQVLKLSGGQLSWGADSGGGGGVSSISSGLGLTGGPITTSGTLAIDTSIVPRLNVANVFPHPSNVFVGTFTGNGTGVTGLNGANLQDNTVNSNKLDAATRALLGGTGGGFNVGPSNNYNGTFTGNGLFLTNINAANVASGVLGDARLSANVALRNAHQTFTGSNAFSGVTVMANGNNSLAGVFTGNGANLTALNGASLQINSVNSNKLDAATRALLGGNGGGFNVGQSNSYNGTFTGNGAGLTNITATFTNTLAGDVTGLPGASVVARIRGVNVSATVPAANQLLRYNGSTWIPGAVVLGTDVSGTLAIANGGTGTGTAAAARSNLGAAASGANADITSLTGLTTPLSPSQGGLGISSFAIGDLLYANTPTTLAKLPDVATGNALISGGVGAAPAWGKISLATHVSGTLSIANGGTAGTSAIAARANLGAASSGINSDITALSALVTPLLPAQGGSGQGSYAAGDILFAPSANTLARRAIGAAGTVLTSRGGVPIWTNANDHNHFGQAWISGGSVDGLYVQNTSSAAAASGVAGIASAISSLNYGVFGQSASSEGTGVQGLALAGSGFTMGVNGQAASTDGTGVYGVVTATSGANSGVIGETSSPQGTGVFGQALATTGTPVGVYGYVAAATGYGLYTPNRLYVGHNAYVGGHLTIGTGSRIQADLGTASVPGITFFNNQSSGMYSPATNTLGLVTSGSQRIHVAADGKVGIGRVALANRLEVEGEASKTTASGWLANSDAAIKRDVHRVTGALAKVAQIRPVAFRYTAEYLAQHPGIEDKTYYNVIAQEFAEVFPESVKSSGETLGGREILQVDTYPAAIYSVAAVQELQALAQKREQEIVELREQNRRLEARLSAIERKLAAGR